MNEKTPVEKKIFHDESGFLEKPGEVGQERPSSGKSIDIDQVFPLPANAEKQEIPYASPTIRRIIEEKNKTNRPSSTRSFQLDNCPRNSQTMCYVPANDTNTGFIRKKYHEEFMGTYINELEFDKIIDQASIICAKAYEKGKKTQKANPIYRMLLFWSFFLALIFWFGVMIDGKNRFWIWCIFLWISLILALIVLSMTFITNPKPRLNYRKIAEVDLATYFSKINDTNYSAKGIAWGIGPAYNYICIQLPKDGVLISPKVSN